MTYAQTYLSLSHVLSFLKSEPDDCAPIPGSSKLLSEEKDQSNPDANMKQAIGPWPRSVQIQYHHPLA